MLGHGGPLNIPTTLHYTLNAGFSMSALEDLLRQSKQSEFRADPESALTCQKNISPPCRG